MTLQFIRAITDISISLVSGMALLPLSFFSSWWTANHLWASEILPQSFGLPSANDHWDVGFPAVTVKGYFWGEPQNDAGASTAAQTLWFCGATFCFFVISYPTLKCHSPKAFRYPDPTSQTPTINVTDDGKWITGFAGGTDEILRDNILLF